MRADDGVGVLSDVLLVELDILRVNREQPAVGHCVARVDGEVHEHLLELIRVGEHGIQGCASVATSSTSSPISLESIGVRPATTSFSWSTRGRSTWRRLNASS